MDELTEKRLQKHGFSNKIIMLIAENVPHNQKSWVDLLLKFTPEQVKKANADIHKVEV